MGQTPAKFFPPPLPYGQSPDSGALMQAVAPPLAPQQNFLPLNSPDPQPTQPQQAQTTQPQFGNWQNYIQQQRQQMFGGGGGASNVRAQLNRYADF